jgi:hypothetical protein
MRPMESGGNMSDAAGSLADKLISESEPSIYFMSASLSDMRLPRGRLLVVENGVEIEILKREMPESASG